MNIFYLDTNPKLAAQYHCDKHCIKMILEYCQLLSTTHRVLDGNYQEIIKDNGKKAKRWLLNDERENWYYQATHIQHPCAIWVRQSTEHYRWLYQLLSFCLQEYTVRYTKHHACTILYQRLELLPINMISLPFIEPPQAMPEQYKVINDSVQAYRNYYCGAKRAFAVWKSPTKIPDWYI